METEAIWTWALIAALALVALLPLLWAAVRRPRGARLRGAADVALYRAQLVELDREREAGRLDETGHRAAVIEVQRRLLAAAPEAPAVDASAASTRKPARRGAAAPPARADAAATDPQAAKAARIALLGAVALVPAFAVWAYMRTGTPGMPSATYVVRQDAQARDDALLATLRQRLAALEPASEPARAGYALLGNAERTRGRLEAAAAAYRDSLRAGFDAQVAGQLAQVLLEQDKLDDARVLLAAALPRAPRDVGLRFLSGLVAARAGQPEEARRIWQALVDEAPPEAPWRAMVQRRMGDLP